MLVNSVRLRFYAIAKPLLLGLMLPFLMVACPISQAALQVSPTQIFVAAERNAAGLTLINTNDTPLHVQVRVFEWRQQDGEDQLLPSKAIVASPPMLKLEPGINQLVRIVRNGPSPTTTESSYRIIIDELPIKIDTASLTTDQIDNSQPNGLQFRLRYSIPVFLAPSKQVAVQPILNTQLITRQNASFLQIDNYGNGHAHIADLTWIQGEKRVSIAAGLAGYVLPGQQRQWQLPDDLDLINGGAFTARTNGEPIERILVPISAAD